LEACGQSLQEVLLIGDRATVNSKLALSYDDHQVRYLAGLEARTKAHRALLVADPDRAFQPLDATSETARYWGKSCSIPFEHEGRRATHQGLIVISGPMRRAWREARVTKLRRACRNLRVLRSKIGTPYYRSVARVQRSANAILKEAAVRKFMLQMPEADEAPPDTTTYVVQPGDWLRRIADRFGTTVSAILALNPDVSNPNRIYVGQRLRVPTEGTAFFERVNVALIALDDGGPVGCGDSIVPVEVEVEPTQTPLTAALNALFAIDEEFYGQSGLYNALHNSDLSVEGIDIEDGEATINLAGELSLAGECDDPRVAAQLRQTALQFSTVDEATFYLNGEPLDQVLGGQD
jgi:LysM repeat protein